MMWPSRLIACFLLSGPVLTPSAVRAEAKPGISLALATNVLQLSQMGDGRQRVTCSIRFEGVVAWASPADGRFVFQDCSGAELFDLGPQAQPLHPGQRIAIDGIGSGGGVGAERRFGSLLVIDNDGVHGLQEKTASLPLSAGQYPIEVCWFTRDSVPALEVWYEGPGLARQQIPASALFRQERGSPDENARLVNGLDYQAYEGDWWQLPDFQQWNPVKGGSTTNFSVGLRSRGTNAALNFSGFLAIPRPGRYTFSTVSDGGSQLYLELLRIHPLGETAPPVASPVSSQPMLLTGPESHWASAEGTVSFVGKAEQPGWDLELDSPVGKLPLTLADAGGDSPASLVNSRIRATGLYRNSLAADGRIGPGAMWVPELHELEVLERRFKEAPKPSGQLPLLTTAEQIKRLTRSDALRGYPVHLRGAITWSGGSAVVIQDKTAGIFVAEVPVADADGFRAGEYWDITGITSAQFSPMVLARQVKRLGLAAMPDPLRPTWDQLINGSLDTQWVEVRGVVTGLRSNTITLLTHGGKIKLDLPEARPEALQLYEGTLVRVRGCLWAAKDETTHVFKIGEVEIHNAAVAVDEPAPANPFLAPPKRAGDLLLYDAQAGAFQRVLVRGQLIHHGSAQYFLMDGSDGLRFVPKTTVPLHPGDVVEVVGFPDLSGPSPVLREALVRRTGHSSLPDPTLLSEDDLLASIHDSTLVKVQALLTKLATDQQDQVLGLQIGQRNFIARITADPLPLQHLRVGSRLELTGTYVGRGGDRIAGRDIDSFELLLNSPSDIRTLAQPPWWTLERLLPMVGVLAAVLGIALVWIGLLRRQVEQRTQQLKSEIQGRQEVERQRAVEAERSRIARDLHDDLGSSLTEISLLADAGPGSPPSLERAGQRFRKIADRARAVVNALDVIVWLVNPRKDVLPFLAGYLASYAEEYLSASGIACRLKMPREIPPVRLSAEVRHSVFLAVKEALRNIVAHAHASEVLLELSVRPDRLTILVADNGCGFECSQNPQGNGLANLRERLAGIGGRCEIASGPEAGTQVTFALTLNASDLQTL